MLPTRSAADRSPARSLPWISVLAVVTGLAGASGVYAQTIGATAASPASIGVNTPTAIVFTAQIADPRVIAEGVNLLKTDASGRTLAIVGRLRDDGTNGDAVAGDGTFSFGVSVQENTAGQIYYRVSAPFKGVLRRTLSSLIVVSVRSLPTIAVTLSPAPGSSGWRNGPVTADYTCAPGGSPIVSCPPAQVVATEGAVQTVTGAVTDASGGSASVTSDPFNIDRTAPTIAVALSPEPGPGGFYSGPVTARFTCSDALSGVVACPPDQVVSAEGPNQTVTGAVSDVAGNSASITSPPFSIVTGGAGPTISVSLSPQPNGNGWHNTPVTARFSCAPGGSPIASCPADQVIDTDGASQAVTGTVTDTAGNTAIATATVNLDRAPPLFALSSPANGTPVFVPTPTVTGTVADPLSGIAAVTCEGNPATLNAGIATCSPTLIPGNNAIDIAITDIAGNVGTATLELLYKRVPTVTLTAPANLSYLNITPTTVNGTVDDETATVTVNSIPAAVVNGQFSLAVPISEGPNTVTATATSPEGAVGTASLEVTLDTTPPRVTVTSPPDQFVTSEASISVAGIVNDIVVGTVNEAQAQVTVNGVVAQVANRTFLAPDVALALGPNVVQVVGRDRTGNFATTQVTVIRQAVTESLIRAFSGNNQSAEIGAVAPAPLVVSVTDVAGNPLAGKPVIFKVTQNDGLVATGSAPAPTVVGTTDAQGQAQAQFTLGMRAGAGGNAVEAYSVGITGTAIFTATGIQGPPGKIVVDTGNDQIGAIGQPLPKPLIAVVVDPGNNRRGGVDVTYTVREGGGSFGGAPSITVTSDPDGRVAATLTLGLQEGNANNLIEVTFASNQGFPAAFTASGRAPGDPVKTTISGVVLDNSNLPIPGVTVRAILNEQLTASPLSVQQLPAVQTDAQGQFTIPQAPGGLVELLVEGSTAAPAGTYPSLEYEMVTVAGQTNTVGLPIYLLPIQTANQLCVTDTTGGGTLTIPEAPGFSLTFSPGQVTFPGNSKTGCVSVTVVNREKVPMVPGFGQQPRFIVTIQPAGAAFNPPAAITLPNVDGLKPRAVTEMYSFDHDISSFVAIGTGTVSDDGQVIRSDVGVGVLKAGWHCGGDPQARGTVADCPVCNYCEGATAQSATCIPDPGQAGHYCGTVYNNCFIGKTCGVDTALGFVRPTGACQGGQVAPDFTRCYSGGASFATCQDGVCTGNGSQCPIDCADADPCTIDLCRNGECVHVANPRCQSCRRLPDETPCDSGGTLLGQCKGEICTGTNGQCPKSCADGDPYTIDVCKDAVCSFESDPTGQSCNGVADNTPCGVGGSCRSGRCDDRDIELSVSVAGPVQPLRTGGSNQTTVQVRTSPIVSDMEVTLTVEGIVNSGGHRDLNHIGLRTPGSLMSGTQLGPTIVTRTDTGGNVNARYIAPAVGQQVRITARGGGGEQTAMIDVRVPLLEQLAAGFHYKRVGETPSHPSDSNHWGTYWANSGLRSIAQKYHDEGASIGEDWGRLRYNDQSLPFGGKFDIRNDWGDTGDHAEHRDGRNADVSFLFLKDGIATPIAPSRRRQVLEQLFYENGSPNFLRHSDHWHLRFLQ